MPPFERFKAERAFFSRRLAFFSPPARHGTQISRIPIVFQCKPLSAVSPRNCAAGGPLSESAHKFGRFGFIGPYGITDSTDTPCQGRGALLRAVVGGKGELQIAES